MKKFKEYLKKNNITYAPRQYNENYFNNSEPVQCEAIQVTTWFDSENYYIQRANMEKVKKYCARYGYTIINSWFTNVYDTIIITTAADAALLKLYWAYKEPAAVDCENLMHRYYTEPLTINLNHELKKIMFKYGAAYNAALIQAATA